MDPPKTPMQLPSPPLSSVSDGQDAYLGPPSMMSWASHLSLRDLNMPSSEGSSSFSEVSPSDSISQRGGNRSDARELDINDLTRRLESLSSSDSGAGRSGSLLLNRMLAEKPFPNGLPFVKYGGRINGVPHFRLSLEVDRQLEEQQIRDSFVPLPQDLIQDEEMAGEEPAGSAANGADSGIMVDDPSDSGRGSGASGAGTTDGTEDPPANGGSTSGVSGGSTDGLHGKFNFIAESSPPFDASADMYIQLLAETNRPPGAPPLPRPGRQVEEGDEEYPPGPPSSPEHYRNRFFEIHKSGIAGYGAFASQDLQWGQKILVEPELFRADHVSLYDEFDKLTDASQQAFKRMAAHSTVSGYDKVTSIFRTNSFNVGEGQGGIYLVAARFNHACSPRNNVSYRFDHEKRRIMFTMTHDVAAGTELTITYGSSREELFAQWGFVCRCGGCVPLSDEEVLRLSPGTDWDC
ncbi:hypothetical protein PGQ11_014380 [Apiospora arundinis]|uniref:SET domain-containing protein n=1 Tax=Apiospora arundinis TaxID=335852 RepID=A0ABR2HS46_9PEZI